MTDPDLALLEAAAREGGEIALKHWQAAPRQWNKPDNAGPVSEADLEVDAHLRQRLFQARPDYGWLSEETPDSAERLARRRVFIVDPIDGTRAFLSGEKSWAVALAVVEDGEVTHAAIHLPARQETYLARLGGGASRNGVALAASARTRLDGADVLATRPNFQPRFWRGGTAPQVTRHFRPSLAYRMALVAAGRFDAMFTFRPAWEWDVAAGALLIAEAGGLVTDMAGSPPRFNNPDPRIPGLIAAPRALHGQIHARLATAET